MTKGYKIFENDRIKCLRGPNTNYNFSKITGYTETWGATEDDELDVSEVGPMVADVEITTSCKGMFSSKTGKYSLCPCTCYKKNTPNGTNMSLDTFKKVLDKFPQLPNQFNPKQNSFIIQQIAFGLDSEARSNPDTFPIFEYCRSQGIIPNLTIAHVDDEIGANISKLCGACAVSRYTDKNVCYDSIDLLTNKYGMNQVNIHQIVHEDVYDEIMETLHDIQTDARLSKLNAIVFLQLKNKGRGIFTKRMSQEKFKQIIDYCVAHNIRYGSDSCGYNKLINCFSNEYRKKVESYLVGCESLRESFYLNVNAVFSPCSFFEKEAGAGWDEGINMLEINDFFTDIWNHERAIKFRKAAKEAIGCGKGCSYFKI